MRLNTTSQSIKAPAGLASVLSAALVLGALAFGGGSLACGEIKVGNDHLDLTKPEDFAAGEILVWFQDDLSASDIDALVAATGGEIKERSRVTPSRLVLSVPEGEEEAYVEAYAGLEKVRVAEKNYTFHIPPDPGGEGGEIKKNKISID